MSDRTHPMRRRVVSILTTVVMVAALLLAALMVVPTLLGFERYVIVSGSMVPTIPVGSVVYDEVVPVGDIEIGDIITFVPPPEYGIDDPVTHRVVKITSPARTAATRASGSSRPRGTRTRTSTRGRWCSTAPTRPATSATSPTSGMSTWRSRSAGSRSWLIAIPSIALIVYIIVTLWRVSGDGVREQRRREQEQAGARRTRPNRRRRS